MITKICTIKRSQNDQRLLREIRRNDLATTKCDSIYNVNDRNICSSLLIYYLGSKNEDEFVIATTNLGYLMFTKNIDQFTTVMLQESNISKKSPKTVLKYLSNFLVLG